MKKSFVFISGLILASCADQAGVENVLEKNAEESYEEYVSEEVDSIIEVVDSAAMLY